jgi:hypothetical protein
MNMKLVLLVWVIATSWTLSPHALHISKTLIEWTPAKKEVQISVHLFIDDLEKSLAQKGLTKLGLGTDKESAQAQAALTAYLTEHVKVWVDQKALAFSFVGKETTKDLQGLYCYLVVSNVKSLKSLTFQNAVLLDLYDDQQNMIEFKAPKGVVRYNILEGKHRTCTLTP